MVDVAAVRFIMRALIDYKKNLWITVGAMCASLATTAFLLLLAEDHRLNKVAKALVSDFNPLETSRWVLMTFFCIENSDFQIRVVDLCAFIALPCLLAARRLVAGSIIQFGQNALNAAGRVVDVNPFQSELICSIQPRGDNVTRCSDIIIKSLFPVKVSREDPFFFVVGFSGQKNGGRGQSEGERDGKEGPAKPGARAWSKVKEQWPLGYKPLNPVFKSCKT